MDACVPKNRPLLAERYSAHVLAHEYACHVGRLVPCRLAGHGVGDESAVDDEVAEADVLDGAVGRVARKERQL